MQTSSTQKFKLLLYLHNDCFRAMNLLFQNKYKAAHKTYDIFIMFNNKKGLD